MLCQLLPAALLFSLAAFTTQTHALRISLDVSRTYTGVDCGIATYRFGIVQLWNNTNLNLEVEVVDQHADIASVTLNRCAITSLRPGLSASCTATRAVSLVRVGSGAKISSTAIPSRVIETTIADSTVQANITPVLAVDKIQPTIADAGSSGGISVGGTLTYTARSGDNPEISNEYSK